MLGTVENHHELAAQEAYFARISDLRLKDLVQNDEGSFGRQWLQDEVHEIVVASL